MNTYITDGEIKVGGMCLESDPCQHEVSVDGGESELMSGKEIVKLFEERKLEVPEHFNYLKKLWIVKLWDKLTN